MGNLIWRHAVLWSAALSLCGCGGGDSADRSGRAVVLFAAASTSDALDEIRERFRRETGVEVTASYAASSTLAEQIAYGAGADVFVSASTKWVDYLDRHENGLVAQRRDLLGNRLVIVVPADSPLDLHKPEDLLGKEIRHLALADYTAVPAGIYARQALTKLGLWQRLKEKVAAGTDVRSALSYVETGAAEAGLVYATDAAVSTSVKVAVEIPTDLTEPICYPVALLRQGAGNPKAESFYRYLSSPQAAAVFRKHGFVVHTDSAAGSYDPPADDLMTKQSAVDGSTRWNSSRWPC
jgi:molybdate transport system substrate-binding protein